MLLIHILHNPQTHNLSTSPRHPCKSFLRECESQILPQRAIWIECKSNEGKNNAKRLNK